MRPWLPLFLAAAACGDPVASPDAMPPIDIDARAACGAHADAATDVYAAVCAAVDADRLTRTLRELTGGLPVTVGGDTFAISERYSDAGRAHFRAYWRATFEGLGMTVRQLDYQDPSSTRPGVDLEAVLPGRSPDSIVIIVHYDSMGVAGLETENPGVDDDMTGMAIQLETARALAPYRDRLEHTVRFVATDEEELGFLAGARAYARTIRAEADAAGFALVAAVDDEQTGWNCARDGLCADRAPWPVFDIDSCGEAYTNPALGDQFEAAVARYGAVHVSRGCLGANSDHYAMWEVGVPAVVFTEHSPFNNPHFDQNGGDTFDKIDLDYYEAIARPAIAFQAQLVGIAP